jgi:uncharacterized protein (UPF0548 family)
VRVVGVRQTHPVSIRLARPSVSRLRSLAEASSADPLTYGPALAAPLPLGWIEVVCRVVDVVDEPDRFGFAYGTLPVHPDQGEESFTVALLPDGGVVFEIIRCDEPLPGCDESAVDADSRPETSQEVWPRGTS